MALAGIFALVFGFEAWRELLLGLVLAVLNGLSHAWINGRAVDSGPRQFLRWGIAMNALRLAAVLTILVAICFMTSMQTAPFAVTLVGCTMVFLTSNAVALAHPEKARSRK
jgi:hypothetical protein